MRTPDASSIAYAVFAGLCILIGFIANDASRVTAALRWTVAHLTQ